jgi:hypothetical protein
MLPCSPIFEASVAYLASLSVVRGFGWCVLVAFVSITGVFVSASGVTCLVAFGRDTMLLAVCATSVTLLV